MIGELHRSFRLPDHAAGQAALAALQKAMEERQGAAFSANVWSLEEGDPPSITILVERSARATLNKHARIPLALGGVEVEAPEEIIRAQQEKRQRGMEALVRGGPETLKQGYSEEGWWIDQHGRLTRK